jgi:soluble lytic murein transglycosylase
MHWLKILTPLCAASLLTVAAPLAQAQNPGDSVMLDMQSIPQPQSVHADPALPSGAVTLEPWAAYWELKNRLETAAEIQGFLNRYAGTYQEDRLRNDWLLLLGKQRDWNTFSQVYPKFRMRDDKSVTCYALLADASRAGARPCGPAGTRSGWRKRMPMTAAPRPPASCMPTS